MRARALAASIVLVTVGAAVAVVDRPSTAPDSLTPDGVDAAKVLAARQVPRSSRAIAVGISPSVSARRLRRWVLARTADIPLPDGGNFNGIRWEADRRPIPVAVADAVLQLNARCQWLRAQRDRRETSTASEVLRLSTRWPAVTQHRAAGPFDLYARADDPGGCDATLRRERAYALALGLTPTT